VVVLVTLLTVVVALLAVLVAGLLRTHAEILRALHDLDVNLDPAQADPPARRTQAGIAAPGERATAGFDLTGATPVGEAVHIAVLGADRLTLLAFLSSTCLTCRGFWEAFTEPALDVPGDARLVIVTKGLEAESESALRKLAPRTVPTVLSSDAWTNYGVPVAPYFVLVDGLTGEVVGEGAAASWDQVRNLMGQSLADAGLAVRRGRIARDRSDGGARAAQVDDALRAAGIGPGHPSLHPPGGSGDTTT
jgi:hypothetical protein